MNWYFLHRRIRHRHAMLGDCRTMRWNSRDHFLEALQCLLDIGASGHIVLDSFDERSVWDATFVCGRVLAVVR
jgi:hypothetical protein